MGLLSDIESCFPAISQQFNAAEMKKFLDSSFADLSDYHCSLGLWIRNNLLYNNPQFMQTLACDGLYSADDMSMLIIRLFYICKKTQQESESYRNPALEHESCKKNLPSR